MNIVEGDIPSVLTVSHDGTLVSIGGVNLPENTYSLKSRDLGTFDFAAGIYSYMQNTYGHAPYIVSQNISRKYRTPQICDYFDNSIVELLNNIYNSPSCNTSKLMVLDLHGYGNAQSKRSNRSLAEVCDSFDVILGTNFRRTVGRTFIDRELGSFLTVRGSSIYVPGEIPREGGESYKGTNPKSVANIVTSAFSGEIPALQLELPMRHRYLYLPEGIKVKDSNDREESITYYTRPYLPMYNPLIRDIGDFIATYCL